MYLLSNTVYKKFLCLIDHAANFDEILILSCITPGQDSDQDLKNAQLRKLHTLIEKVIRLSSCHI